MANVSLGNALLASAIALSFSSFAEAAPRASASKTASAVHATAPNPQPNGATVLFNQTSSPGTAGILAMRNLDAGSEDYDAEMADDFAVPVGGWAVSQVRVGSFFQAGTTVVPPAVAGDVVFYANAAGVPGAAVAGCSYSNIALSYDSATSYSTLNLPTECALPTGTFWIGFKAALSYNGTSGGNAYVLQQSTVTTGTPVWRNPGDGFSSGCTTFTALTGCDFATNGGMTVQLLGRTTPVTLQAFGVD